MTKVVLIVLSLPSSQSELWAVMYYVLGVLLLLLSTNVPYGFGTVLAVWYFVVFGFHFIRIIVYNIVTSGMEHFCTLRATFVIYTSCALIKKSMSLQCLFNWCILPFNSPFYLLTIQSILSETDLTPTLKKNACINEIIDFECIYISDTCLMINQYVEINFKHNFYNISKMSRFEISF
jgi:hypothetical protein